MSLKKLSFLRAQSALNFVVVVLMLVTILTWKINKKVLQSSLPNSMFDTNTITNDKFTNSVCKPKTKIGFLKIHKAASSSVQNILLRYGINHQLNFVLPQKKYENQFFDDKQDQRGIQAKPFQADWLNSVSWHSDLVKNKSYDIMALHSVWNHNEISRLLGPDAIYVTIVRHPSTSFQSLFSYFDLGSFYKLDLPQYIKMLDKSKTLHSHRGPRGLIGLNQQLFDMGVPAKKLFDVNKAYSIASKVIEKFDLVLVYEHFEESMVLMADMLCWPLDFVAGIKHNVLPLSYKENLTDVTVLEKWQAGEIKLYNKLYEKFQERIESFGIKKMADEVKRLKEIQQNLEKICDIKQHDDENQTKEEKYKYHYSVPYNKHGIHYIAGNDTLLCRQLISSELNLIDEARVQQTMRWRKWKKMKRTK